MHRDSDRHKLFNRRAFMLAGGKAGLVSLLLGRMYYLQVMESERYATLADENRINMRLLPPPRGHIVDRFGEPIAVNQQNYRALLVREQAQDVRASLEALRAIIPIGENEMQKILREVRRRRSFVPVTVRENLDWRDVARIEVNTPDLPGVMIDVGQSRYYPHGEDAAHLLGYVSAVSEADVTGDPLLELPGFRIGKAGVEKVYDRALRGTGGTSQVEVNAFGRVIRELSRQEGGPGAKITLTIDMELQKAVGERLGDQSAAAVILDVHSGDVLAMASTPSFDPNAFNRGLNGEEWKSLSTNPKSPLTNKAIAGQYAPGSTFKMIVALAALEKGVITPATRIGCSGSVELGDAKFHCWKRGGHGVLDMVQGIMHSCDVYFYEVARRTGIERIADMARRFGLGTGPGINLPGEAAGLVPGKDWKLAVVGSPWQVGETMIAGIGQGYMLVTPLQLAVMTARIANGGREVSPRLIKSVESRQTEGRPEEPLASAASAEAEPAGLEITPAHLRAVIEGMERVVNEPGGTAHRARIAKPGFEMAGKTGSVQVRRITKAEREEGVRKNEDLPWKERDHALFVGFAPVHAPRFAVAVVVEHGGSGSGAAAPIARDILLKAQQRALQGPAVKAPDPSSDGKKA